MVPGEKSYSKATRSHNSVFNTIIFTDSIPKGIKCINLIVCGASSHQLLHYLAVHLKDKSIDTVIIHIGINDLLINSSRSGMDNLIYNIKKITEKCLMFGVKSVFISGLVYTTRVDVCLLERIHVLIFDFCWKNSFIYIDNRNTRSDSLYKEGLYLIDKGKAFLADNLLYI